MFARKTLFRWQYQLERAHSAIETEARRQHSQAGNRRIVLTRYIANECFIEDQRKISSLNKHEMSNRSHDDNIHRSFLPYIKTETSALSDAEHKMSNRSQGRSYSRHTHNLCFMSDGSYGSAAHAKINPTCSGDFNMNQSFPYTH